MTGSTMRRASGGLGGKYWEAVDKGETPERPYKANPLWDAIQKGLAE